LLTDNPPKFGVKNPRDGFLKNIFSFYEIDFHCIFIRLEIIQYLRIRLEKMGDNDSSYMGILTAGKSTEKMKVLRK